MNSLGHVISLAKHPALCIVHISYDTSNKYCYPYKVGKIWDRKRTTIILFI